MSPSLGTRVATRRGEVREQARRVAGDRARLGIVAAGALGLVLRLVAVAYASRPPVGLFDPARYVGYAGEISAGRGMLEPLTGQPTAYFPPGYPYFLGALDWVSSPLTGDIALVGGLAQAVLGAVAVVLAGLLARRLASPAAGVVAALIVAVEPNLVLHTAALLSETLSITVLLGFLVALVPPGTERRWPGPVVGGRMVGAGLLLGALLLVRPVAAGVVGAAVVAWLVAGEGWRRTATRTGIVLGVGLLCLAPWTVRNVVRMDSFVVLSTNTGDNLCIGHAPGATGGFRAPVECETGTGVQDGTAAEVASDQEKTDRGIRFAREGWRDEPGLVWDRFRILVAHDADSLRAVQSYGADPWSIGDRYDTLARAFDGAWFAIGALGAVGLVRLAWGRRGEQLLLPLAVLAVLAAPLATFADPRFKVPVVPLLAVGAAALVTWAPVRRR